jgi:hypothetical protein
MAGSRRYPATSRCDRAGNRVSEDPSCRVECHDRFAADRIYRAKVRRTWRRKVVPDDDDVLLDHERRLIEQEFAAAAVEKLRPKIIKRAAKVKLNAKLLRKRIEAQWEKDPSLCWDDALAVSRKKANAPKKKAPPIAPQPDLFSPGTGSDG